MNTLIRMRGLTEVFPSDDAEPVHAYIVRLAVLYEDLRIELYAIAEPSIPILGGTDERYRKNYFLRRSIATLVEFAETIRLLNECDESRTIKESFDQSMRPYWDKAARFFQRHEQFFKNVRNDIGGHFGSAAATFTVRNLSAEAVGKLEIRKDKAVRLHFVGELVATATLRHLFGSSNEHKFQRLVRKAILGFRYATQSMHCVTAGYLWERFGR
jgi:hypothetical protein